MCFRTIEAENEIIRKAVFVLCECDCLKLFGTTYTHEYTQNLFLSSDPLILSFSLLSFLSQLDPPVVISPQLLMLLLVYVIIYKLALWNMNT